MTEIEFGRTKPAGTDRSTSDGIEGVAQKNLTDVEGEPVHLPVEIPVRAAGELAGVEFTGEGIVRIIGYRDADYARTAGVPEWKGPYNDVPDFLIYIDKKAGQMIKLKLDASILGWWRAKKPGRLGTSTGVNIAISPVRYSDDGVYYEGLDGPMGWVFFNAGKYNILLEFLLNKIMGWTIWNKDDVWSLLTADMSKQDVPKEIWKDKRNFREHFLINQWNKWQIFPYVRTRMGHDPAVQMPVIAYPPYILSAEDAWVDRYIVFASALERFIAFEHPECENLFPDWTVDVMSTQAVKLLYRVQEGREAPGFRILDARRVQQLKLMDIAGNVVGLGESLQMSHPKFIFCPEHISDSLVRMRRTEIDSPKWLELDSGVEFINKRNEYFELLLEGRVEEANRANDDLFRLYNIVVKSSARTKIYNRFVKDLSKQEDYISNLESLVRDSSAIMCDWDLILAYVTECVRRGQWKPVKVSSLRISRPPMAA